MSEETFYPGQPVIVCEAHQGYILGGPNVISTRFPTPYSAKYWTVDVEPEYFGRPTTTTTRVFEEPLIKADPTRPNLRREGVAPSGYCSSCEEDDMLFYLEDYICAWCREHIEEGRPWNP